MLVSIVQAVSGSAAQEQAKDNAKAAFARLPSGHALFQQCVNNQETVYGVLESLHRQYGVHKWKRFNKTLESFHRSTSWMNNISGSIDVAVQASSGIACPLWAPIKFLLKVSQDHVEAAEQTLAVLQTISDSLSRLDLYEQLRDDRRSQTALVNVFTDVLEFALLAYQYFSYSASSTEEEPGFRCSDIENSLASSWLVDRIAGWREIISIFSDGYIVLYAVSREIYGAETASLYVATLR